MALFLSQKLSIALIAEIGLALAIRIYSSDFSDHVIRIFSPRNRTLLYTGHPALIFIKGTVSRDYVT
jgi:hypothetical protein